MKKITAKASSTILAFVLFGLIPLLSSCNSKSSIVEVDSGKLDSKKAQNAIDVFMVNQTGKAKVMGVREESASSAIADLYFDGLLMKMGANTSSVTEPGRAVFIRYNDGRWIMTKVYVGGSSSFMRIGSQGEDLQIEAK